jgi:hypothetical protein
MRLLREIVDEAVADHDEAVLCAVRARLSPILLARVRRPLARARYCSTNAGLLIHPK